MLNEQRQELYVRFHVGYAQEVADRVRVKVGQGVTGRAAQSRQAVLVADVTQEDFYVEAVPNVRSELAIPLIVKNRVIGVIDIEAREKGYFTEEHKRLLTLIASRMAVGIENARLHTRTTRQARTLLLLNEIARELTSILNLDQLLKRIAELLNRLIDYQMFSILLLDETGRETAAPLLAALRRKTASEARHPDGPRSGGVRRAGQGSGSGARRRQE